ncbi:hypothetical protein NC651_021322 [Populus alba x Populus x berolinensis]|nr:hypothetical protein NC651_021322 [Populus alba x Populus x berolinensis]
MHEVPATTSTKKGPSPVPALQQNIPGVGMMDHNLTNVVSSPAEDSHSGTSHSHAPVEKWQDLFGSNHNTITGPKLLHFSSSCNDLPCDLSSNDLDHNYDVWQLCIVAYVAGKSPELDLLVDLKSFIVINLPNGATLNQSVIYETLPRFCKLCKVLGHNTGTCTSHPAPVVARPLGKKSHSPIVANRGRSVFNRLRFVAEPSLKKTKGQIGESSYNYDPITTEATVASDGWEIVKSKKARKSPGILVGATHTANQVSTTP